MAATAKYLPPHTISGDASEGKDSMYTKVSTEHQEMKNCRARS